MKYKTIKQVWDYKYLEQLFTWVEHKQFQMFDLYVSWWLSYKQIWKTFWWVSKQWVAICCKKIYNKILKLQQAEWNLIAKELDLLFGNK